MNTDKPNEEIDSLPAMATEPDTVIIEDSANFQRLLSGEPIVSVPIVGEPHLKLPKP